MKLIIIDDDYSILESLKLALEIEGCQVSVLAQGQKAYNFIKKNKPDIIILDFLLSGITGDKIAEKLKSDQDTKNIPIIMLSAHPSAFKYAKLSGVDSFLSKPFELEELLSEIGKYSFAKEH